VWLIAAITASVSGIERGFVTLFFGGILIAPIGMLIVRTIFRRGGVAVHSRRDGIDFRRLAHRAGLVTRQADQRRTVTGGMAGGDAAQPAAQLVEIEKAPACAGAFSSAGAVTIS
jgi:hypothetical protein